MRILSACNHPFDRTNNSIITGLVIDAGNGVQAALRIQLLRGCRISKRHPGNAPVSTMHGEYAVRVNGLMCAMKCADAKMHNTDALLRRIILRPGNRLFKQVLRCRRQALHHLTDLNNWYVIAAHDPIHHRTTVFQPPPRKCG
jgi:hypothetical protein